MGLDGDFDKLRRLAASLRELDQASGEFQRQTSRHVIDEVRPVIRDQFVTGSGPYGAWERTKRGKPALVSMKIPNSLSAKAVDGGPSFSFHIPWLGVHHSGHIFAPRQVEQGKAVQRFSRKGQLRTPSVFRGRSHTVGRRVLPARPIYPDKGMPAKWGTAINAGVERGVRDWHSRSVG